MPQFFRDKRHEGMQHHQDLIECPSCNRAGFHRSRAVRVTSEDRLDQFQIPVAEAAPRELVDRVGRRVETQVCHCPVELFNRLLDFADDPLVGREPGFGCCQRARRADPVRLAETRRIPQLGREIAVTLDPLLIHLDVAALAFHCRHEEAQRIRAIPVNQAERIDHIALRLGHFRAVCRADKAVQIEARPRRLTRIEIARHHHPRIPEEQDVEAGNQQIVGIVLFKQVGLVRPA